MNRFPDSTEHGRSRGLLTMGAPNEEAIHSPPSAPPRPARGRAMMGPELMIVFAGLHAQRDRKGPKWCRAKGVGEIRRLIGPENVTAIAQTEADGEGEQNRRKAARILVAVCDEKEQGRGLRPPPSCYGPGKSRTGGS